MSEDFSFCFKSFSKLHDKDNIYTFQNGRIKQDSLINLKQQKLIWNMYLMFEKITKCMNESQKFIFVMNYNDQFMNSSDSVKILIKSFWIKIFPNPITFRFFKNIMMKLNLFKQESQRFNQNWHFVQQIIMNENL